MANFETLLQGVRGIRGGVDYSGYRTPERNRQVGGVEGSYHTRQDAAGLAEANDITWQGISWEDVRQVGQQLKPVADANGWKLVTYTHGTSPHLHVEPLGGRPAGGGGSQTSTQDDADFAYLASLNKPVEQPATVVPIQSTGDADFDYLTALEPPKGSGKVADGVSETPTQAQYQLPGVSAGAMPIMQTLPVTDQPLRLNQPLQTTQEQPLRIVNVDFTLPSPTIWQQILSVPRNIAAGAVEAVGELIPPISRAVGNISQTPNTIDAALSALRASGEESSYYRAQELDRIDELLRQREEQQQQVEENIHRNALNRGEIAANIAGPVTETRVAQASRVTGGILGMIPGFQVQFGVQVGSAFQNAANRIQKELPGANTTEQAEAIVRDIVDKEMSGPLATMAMIKVGGAYAPVFRRVLPAVRSRITSLILDGMAHGASFPTASVTIKLIESAIRLEMPDFSMPQIAGETAAGTILGIFGGPKSRAALRRQMESRSVRMVNDADLRAVGGTAPDGWEMLRIDNRNVWIPRENLTPDMIGRIITPKPAVTTPVLTPERPAPPAPREGNAPAVAQPATPAAPLKEENAPEVQRAPETGGITVQRQGVVISDLVRETYNNVSLEEIRKASERLRADAPELAAELDALAAERQRTEQGNAPVTQAAATPAPTPTRPPVVPIAAERPSALTDALREAATRRAALAERDVAESAQRAQDLADYDAELARARSERAAVPPPVTTTEPGRMGETYGRGEVARPAETGIVNNLVTAPGLDPTFSRPSLSVVRNNGEANRNFRSGTERTEASWIEDKDGYAIEHKDSARGPYYAVSVSPKEGVGVLSSIWAGKDRQGNGRRLLFDAIRETNNDGLSLVIHFPTEEMKGMLNHLANKGEIELISRQDLANEQFYKVHNEGMTMDFWRQAGFPAPLEIKINQPVVEAARPRGETVAEPSQPATSPLQREPWQNSDLATTPNIPDMRVKAERDANGKFRLMFTGTRNEVFEGERFNSANEARQFFTSQRELARQSQKPAQIETPQAPVSRTELPSVEQAINDGIKVNPPKGATFVRVTTADGKSQVVPVSAVDALRGAGPYTKVEYGQREGRRATGEFTPMGKPGRVSPKLTRLHAGMPLTDLVDAIKASDQYQYTRSLVTELGQRTYEAGARTFNEWRAKIKDAVGSAWSKVKPMLRKVWDDVKLMVSDESGSTGRGKTEAAAEQRLAIMREEAQRRRADREIGIKKEAVFNQRAERGELPDEQPVTQSHEVVDAEAKLQMAENPSRADELVNEIITDTGAKVGNVEMAILLNRITELDVELKSLDDMATAAKERGNTDSVKAHNQRILELSEAINDVELAARMAGTDTARALEYRRQMMRQDYSLARMLIRKRAANGNDALSVEQIREVTNRQKELEAAYKKLETELEAERTRNSELAQQTAVKEIIKGEQEVVVSDRKKGIKRDVDGQRKALLDSLRKRVAGIDPVTIADIRRHIQALGRTFVADGISELDPLVKAVHGAVREILPKMSERQIMDAMTGYGDFKELSKDEIDVRYRDLKGQGQQTAKLDDMAQGNAPMKTGLERRIPSDKERRLQQQVNQKKKEGGYNVVDPARQLKTTLDAIKTRARNTISDLEFQLANRRQTVKDKKSTPTDPELEVLRTKIEVLRQQYEEMFGKPEMTDAQRTKLAIAAADREYAEIERQIKEGDIGPWKKGEPRPESAELKAARARLKAVRLEREMLRDFVDFYTTPHAKILNAINADIDAAATKIQNGDLSVESRSQGRAYSSEAIEAAKKMRKDLQSHLGRMRADANRTPQSEIDARNIERTIERLGEKIIEGERRLATGDIAVKPKTEKLTTPEIQLLREINAGINREIQQARNALKPKRTPDQIANQMIRTRIEHQTADMLDRMARGDYAPKVKRETVLEDSTVTAKEAYENLKKDYATSLERDRYNKMSLFGKNLYNAMLFSGVPRSVMASIDLSAPFRQGFFFATRYKQFIPAFTRMFGAAGSEHKFNSMMYEIKNRPSYGLMKKAGLALTELDGNLTRREEDYQSQWAEKIPGIRGSGRAYTAFLNQLRADVFDDLITKAEGVGRSRSDMEMVKSLADFINTATGRGNLGALERAAVPLNQLFFSPRLIASRLKLMNPVYYAKLDPFVRREATKSLLSSAALGLSIVSLAAMAGADVDWEPRSSDFLKIQIGNMRLDVWGGFQQYTVAAARLLTGQTKSSDADIKELGARYGSPTRMDIVQRMFIGKLAPIPSFFAALLEGKDFAGEPVTVGGAAVERFIPMSVASSYEAYNDNPWLFPLSLVGLFGIGVQTYKPRESSQSSQTPAQRRVAAREAAIKLRGER